MVPLDEEFLLGVQVQVGDLLEDRRDPLEQVAVQLDRVLVRCHQGSEGFLDLLDLGRRIRRRDGVEGARDAAEEFTAALEGDERVVERRRRGIRDDVVDFGALLLESLLECRQVVL
ncbi:MAG TPA: hypothetical protein DCR63_06195, partial [Microbacterium sp.]|nr:hypothetical protein [Microbacterium sp.]